MQRSIDKPCTELESFVEGRRKDSMSQGSHDGEPTGTADLSSRKFQDAGPTVMGLESNSI